MIPYCILVIEDDADRSFMAELFVSYQRLLYSEIYKVLNHPWDTEDVMQATLVKLIDKIPELRMKERTKLVNYIITAARNTAYNFLREKKRETLSFDAYIDRGGGAADAYLPELHIIAKEEVETLIRKWPMLDERSRYLLEGRYILEKSDEELSIDLAMKPDSIRMAMARARQCAYQLLKDEQL